MTLEIAAHEILESMMPLQERLGGQEALHDGILALQSAVDTGFAVRIGNNIVGSEVDISQCYLGSDIGTSDESLNSSMSLIVGKRAKVSVGSDGVFTSNYVDDSEVRLSRGRIVADSMIIRGSKVVDTHMKNSFVSGSELEGVALRDSAVSNSTIVRPADWHRGKNGNFTARDSRITNYDDTNNLDDPDIELVSANVKKTDDVVSYGEVTVHPDKEGNSVYVIRGNSYPTPKDVLKAMPWLKRKERKDLERELKQLEKKIAFIF